MSTRELEAQALKLPQGERARLAQRLIASLDKEDEVEQAWVEEARCRHEQLRSESVEALPADQVFEEALYILAVAHQRRRPGYWSRRV